MSHYMRHDMITHFKNYSGNKRIKKAKTKKLGLCQMSILEKSENVVLHNIAQNCLF